MNIYTRGGDDGTTGTLGDGRRSKADLLICALGDLDELNAFLGLANSRIDGAENALERIQSQLLDIGAEIASLSKDERYIVKQLEGLTLQLEDEIDLMDKELPALTNFILPGGCDAACYLHVARAVCRRAERSLVELSATEITLRQEVVKYINRLSDWIFVQARYQNFLAEKSDTVWKKQ